MIAGVSVDSASSTTARNSELSVALNAPTAKCFSFASFTLFHEIFFTNDLWLFDPATDYMIRMLPEGFFYDMVMRIGAWFVGGLVLLFAVMAGWRQRALWKFWERHKKNDRKSTDSQ